MKKIILTAIALLGASVMFAQKTGEILSTIEKNGGKVLSGSFVEVRTPAPTSGAKAVTLTGDLIFKPQNFLSMMYDNKDLFSIDGNTMVISQNGANQTFDLTKNLMMRSLSNTLLYALNGVLIKLSAEQDADINAVRNGSDYVVTLTARKKAVRGYCKITAVYKASDCSLHKMTMDEFSGASTSYSLK